jgi:adenylate cyclase
VRDLACANARAHACLQEDVDADGSVGQALTVRRKLRSVPVGASSDLRFVLVCRRPESAVVETRKLAAILVSDVVGYSRLAGSDEDRTLARLRALRSDLIDPTIAVHNGRIVKRTGDGSIVEFRSVVDAVRCAIEVQNGMVERNAGLPPERRIEFRVGIHLGDVVEESDGDLMGDGVNIAARLEGVAKPGGICLSEDAYRQVKARLDLAASDLGAVQLKNIVERVRVYSLEVGRPTQPPKGVAPKKRSIFVMLGAGIIALAMIAGGFWHLAGANRIASIVSKAPTPAKATHLSIVVLPFTNLSNDPSQDYFADGITENLTTDLSRIRNSFVIARNTAFTFKGKSIPIKEISKELGVRYVLEGSVQRDQNHVRVNAQLIDGDTNAHLWADRFEEDLVDVFRLQDQIVARLANTLGFELVKAEAEKSTYSGNPDAIDLTMRGWAILNEPRLITDKSGVPKALSLFEQALALDPNNVDALVGAAAAERDEFQYSGMDEKPGQIAKIDEMLTRAIRIDPSNARAYVVRGMTYRSTKRTREAAEAAQTAIRLNPSYAPAVAQLAQDLNSIPAEYPLAIANIERAIKLSPRDPEMGRWHWIKGKTFIYMGRYQDAIQELQAALDAGYGVWPVYSYLAVAHGALGQRSEAEAALAQARKLNPKLTIKWYRARVEEPEVIFQGLLKAGLPEQ